MGTECVSSMDLFISFHSGCLHTKSSSLSHFLPSSLPPVSISPFPVSLSLQLCILASCWRVKSEWGIWCYAYEAVVPPQHKKNSSICSNICFLFNEKHFSLQIPDLFPHFFLCQILLLSHKVCRGNVMQHKQTEFPNILQCAFQCPTFFNKAQSCVQSFVFLFFFPCLYSLFYPLTFLSSFLFLFLSMSVFLLPPLTFWLFRCEFCYH